MCRNYGEFQQVKILTSILNDANLSPLKQTPASLWIMKWWFLWSLVVGGGKRVGKWGDRRKRKGAAA
jgi:hypothetical protein